MDKSCFAVAAWLQNAQDQKRAKVWGTLAKRIIQAVKAGGADVAANQKLAEILKLAKAAEVPKDIIDRNMKKATDKSQADYSEVAACPSLARPLKAHTLAWVTMRQMAVAVVHPGF